MKRRLSTLALLFGLACAGTAPVSEAPIDWERIDESWSLHIVTEDPDGGERVTRIWQAVADGTGTFRTDDSRWWQNLQRDPNCRIRVDGVDYPVRADSADTLEERIRIDQAFTEKYGWQERMLFPQDRGATHENYAWLRAR